MSSSLPTSRVWSAKTKSPVSPSATWPANSSCLPARRPSTRGADSWPETVAERFRCPEGPYPESVRRSPSAAKSASSSPLRRCPSKVASSAPLKVFRPSRATTSRSVASRAEIRSRLVSDAGPTCPTRMSVPVSCPSASGSASVPDTTKSAATRPASVDGAGRDTSPRVSRTRQRPCASSAEATIRPVTVDRPSASSNKGASSGCTTDCRAVPRYAAGSQPNRAVAAGLTSLNRQS